eukprot:gene11365-7871_t
MLSCAAIQKLERYAQFGLKRHSLDDFLLTSIKDPKRSNIYALTHEPTWLEAYGAITTASTSAGGVVRISENFIFAVSFAAALVRHDVQDHLFDMLITTLHSASPEAEESTATSATEVEVAKTTTAGTRQRWSSHPLAASLLSPHVLQKKRELESFPAVFKEVVVSAGADTATSTPSRPPAAREEDEDDDESVAPLRLLRVWRDLLVHIAKASNSSSSSSPTTGSGNRAPPDIPAHDPSAVTSVEASTASPLLIIYSDTFTQAVAHLLKTTTDLLLLLLPTVLVLQQYLQQHPPSSSHHHHARQRAAAAQEKIDRLQCMLDDVMIMQAAVVRLFRRSTAQAPLDKELQQRGTAAAALRQILRAECASNQEPTAPTDHSSTSAETDALYRYLHDHLTTKETNTSSSSSAAAAAPPSPPTFLLLLLSHMIDSGLSGMLDSFSLFQRLALLHSALSAASLQFHAAHLLAATPSSANGDGDGTWVPALNPSQRASCAASLVRSLCLALQHVACNRATRLVVYYRGDEMAMMQREERDAAAHSLHTFVTHPPIDPAVRAPCVALFHKHPSEKQQQQQQQPRRRCALQLLVWIVSAPYFFASFCTNASWRELAAEQRRLVLLQRAGQRRQQQRSGRVSSSRSRSSSSTSSTASHASSRSTRGLGGQPAPHDNSSVASGTSSFATAASRASRLSMLSAASAATYQSFLSILPPDAEDAMGPERHESEDGNTNLPLILLEQCVLALYTFLQAYPAAVLDAYGLREVCWESIAKCFALVQCTLTAAVGIGASADEDRAAHSSLLLLNETNNHPTMEKGSSRDGGGVSGAAAAGRATLLAHAALFRRAMAPTAALTPPLFDLGQDVQYNHGLGYECLAMLFARVVAPRLQQKQHQQEELREAEGLPGQDPAPPLPPAEEEGEENVWYRPTDPLTVRQHLEAALAACLSTYEVVAPQVVDRYLCVILRMAARATAAAVQPSFSSRGLAMARWSSAARRQCTVSPARTAYAPPPQQDGAASPTSQLALQFLGALVDRLGRSNQLPSFLDAIFSITSLQSRRPPVSRRPTSPSAAAADLASPPYAHSATAAAQLEDTHALLLSLQHPVVRDTYLEACRQTMDAEQMLQYFIRFLTAVGDEKAEGPTAVDPQSLLLLLRTLSLTLVGLPCAAAISRRVLELSTELDLLLGDFLSQRLEPLLLRYGGTASAVGCTMEEAQVIRAELWREGLEALFHCRALTEVCLQDLGEDSIRDYIEMLEETLWQVSTQVDVVCGSEHRIQDLEEVLGPLHAPKQHESSDPVLAAVEKAAVVAIVQQLVLQRLRLARSIAVLLQRDDDIRCSQAAGLKSMVKYVLSSFGSFQALVPPSTAAAAMDSSVVGALAVSCVMLANHLVEEEWRALGMWCSHPRRLRAALVSLLEATFYLNSVQQSDTSLAGSPPVSDGRMASAPAVWLQRALRGVGGVLVRAVTDAFLQHTVHEDVDAEEARWTCIVSQHHQQEASATQLALSTPLSLAASVLLWLYGVTGHVPYWPALLDHSVRCLRSCLGQEMAQRLAQQPSERHVMVVALQQHLQHLVEQLLLVVSRCLVSEPQSQDTLEKVLGHVCLQEQQPGAADDGASGVLPWWTAHQRRSKGGRALHLATRRGGTSSKGIHQSYVESIGVPLATVSDLQGDEEGAAAAGNPNSSTTTSSSNRNKRRREDDEAKDDPSTPHQQQQQYKLLVEDWCFEEELIRVTQRLWGSNGVWLTEIYPSLLRMSDEQQPSILLSCLAAGSATPSREGVRAGMKTKRDEVESVGETLTNTTTRASKAAQAHIRGSHIMSEVLMDVQHVLYTIALRAAEDLEQCANAMQETSAAPIAAPTASLEKVRHYLTPKVGARSAAQLRSFASAVVELFQSPTQTAATADPDVRASQLAHFLRAAASAGISGGDGLYIGGALQGEDADAAAGLQGLRDKWLNVMDTVLYRLLIALDSPAATTSPAAAPKGSTSTSARKRKSRGEEYGEADRREAPAAPAAHDKNSPRAGVEGRIDGEGVDHPSLGLGQHFESVCRCLQLLYTLLRRSFGGRTAAPQREVLFRQALFGSAPTTADGTAAAASRAGPLLDALLPSVRARTEKKSESVAEAKNAASALQQMARRFFALLHRLQQSQSQQVLRAVESSATPLSSHLESSAAPVETLWVLVKLAEMRFQALHNGEEPLPKPQQPHGAHHRTAAAVCKMGGALECLAAPSLVLAAVLHAYTPSCLPLGDEAASAAAMDAAAADVAQRLLTDGDGGTRAALGPLPPCFTYVDLYSRLVQLVAAQEALVVLEAPAAPAALHQLLHQLLQYLLRTIAPGGETSPTVCWSSVSVARPVAAVVAVALYRLLTQVSGMRSIALQRSLLQLLQVANHLCLVPSSGGAGTPCAPLSLSPPPAMEGGGGAIAPPVGGRCSPAATPENAAVSHLLCGAGARAAVAALLRLRRTTLALLALPAATGFRSSHAAPRSSRHQEAQQQDLEACLAEAAWWFVSSLIEQSLLRLPTHQSLYRGSHTTGGPAAAQDGAAVRSGSAAASATPPGVKRVSSQLTQHEVSLILSLLSRHWLQHHESGSGGSTRRSSRSSSSSMGLLWRRMERLPSLLSGLLEVILSNVATERFPVKVLHAFGALLFHLTRQAEMDSSASASGSRGAAVDGGDEEDGMASHDAGTPAKSKRRTDVEEKATPAEKVSEDGAHTTTTSNANASSTTAVRLQAQAQREEQQRRLFAVASATAAMFHVSERYVSVYTAYSGDTDGLVMDLLRCLHKSRLPKKLAPPIAFRKRRPAPASSSWSASAAEAATLSDLAYISVGSLEGRALLRQAAQRLEEQEGVSGGTVMGRQLFQNTGTKYKRGNNNKKMQMKHREEKNTKKKKRKEKIKTYSNQKRGGKRKEKAAKLQSLKYRELFFPTHPSGARTPLSSVSLYLFSPTSFFTRPPVGSSYYQSRQTKERRKLQQHRCRLKGKKQHKDAESSFLNFALDYDRKRESDTMIFREEIDSFLALRRRDVVRQICTILVFISIAMVGWRHVEYLTHCPSSMVVVISGSMEPGYYRGDLLLLQRRPDSPVRVGDIIVYHLHGRSIPIVHRVLRLHRRERDGKTLYLTKGDNNLFDDRHLYPPGVEWVEEENIIGKAFAYIPRIGYLTLIMAELPFVRYLSIGLILFFFLTLEEDG